MHDQQKVSRVLIAKTFILCAFVVVAFSLFLFGPFKQYLNPETVDLFLQSSGMWAPFLFVLIYAVATAMFVPGSALTVLSAAIFGSCMGFLYALGGALAGSSIIFCLARTLGRDFVGSLIGGKLAKYENAVERNGFRTVFYLRVLCLPFSPVSLVIGLSKVRFWDHFFGTALGVILSMIALSLFGGTLKAVWFSGSLKQLISYRGIFTSALLTFSLFIPILAKKIRKYLSGQTIKS